MLFTHKELHCDVVLSVTLNGVRLRSLRPSYIATSRWAVLGAIHRPEPTTTAFFDPGWRRETMYKYFLFQIMSKLFI